MFPAQLRLAAAALVVLGAASLVYGAVLAVARGDVGETLAYSAIGQVGYVLVAIGVGGPVGLTAAVLYSAGQRAEQDAAVPGRRDAGALVAGAFAIGALSVAGVPPAAGFVGKLELFRAGIVGRQPVAGRAAGRRQRAVAGLHVPGLPAALLAGGPVGAEARPARLPLRLLTAAVALLVLAAGLWPEPLLAVSDRAAEALLAGVPTA